MLRLSLKRSLAYPTAIVAVLAGWWFLEPNNDLIGADARNSSMLTVPDDSDYSRALNAKQQELRARIDYKEQLIVGLLAGDYSLQEVAREFARLNSHDETTLHMMRCAYPGDTDEEKAAYNVLDFLRCRSLPEDKLSAQIQRFRTEIRLLYPR